MGTPQRFACSNTSSVCTSAPRSTDTTTTARSAAAIVLPRVSSKASWPGVSNKVIRASGASLADSVLEGLGCFPRAPPALSSWAPLGLRATS
eukprot:CAMPEP_0171153622 /NCGR_PEP_ID=MMETSP0766_2-20121228/151162_1 /TAXON_ID=439317 /ORGANISM="Gambierdiscus australes, Strain CAWD 149" /LENGTH=91 /DNA_ID=CAMNT_0011617539 /DNA_START=228 /DNA_END=503 /DNA_ORIENTATION=-